MLPIKPAFGPLRGAAIRRPSHGWPQVLTSSQKLSTGVDARNVRNIVLMRPVNSMIEFKQIIGRGTRLYEGKDFFTIYDFVKAYLYYHETLGKPAASRYGATTPKLLRWFKTFNENRTYRDQVKPFNFLLSFHGRLRLALSEGEANAVARKGRRPKARDAKPIANFNKDVVKASRDVFDRETGKPISSEHLKTYREALASYHLSAESKFLDGDHFDRGRTERRHAQVTCVIHIGKEADKWEEQYFTGVDGEAQIEYGVDMSDGSLDQKIRQLVEDLKERGTARRLGVSRTTLRKALAEGFGSLSPGVRGRIASRGRL